MGVRFACWFSRFTRIAFVTGERWDQVTVLGQISDVLLETQFNVQVSRIVQVFLEQVSNLVQFTGNLRVAGQQCVQVRSSQAIATEGVGFTFSIGQHVVEQGGDSLLVLQAVQVYATSVSPFRLQFLDQREVHDAHALELLTFVLATALDVHVDETVITVDRHHVQQLFQLGQSFFFDVRDQVKEFILRWRQLLVVVVVNSDAHQFSDQTGGHGSQARQASDLQLAEHWGLATDDCFGQRVERDGVRPVRVSQYVMYR
ncbi:hypothetical protein D3C71_1297520 [compost metagenome]